jgi:hypothetical protein
MEAVVPRYFFNLHDGRSDLDTDGTELTSSDAARIAAVQFAAGLLGDEAHLHTSGVAWNLEVLDEAGATVCSVDVRVSVSATSV